MNDYNLIFIKIILACILLGLATSKNIKATSITHNHQTPSLQTTESSTDISLKLELTTPKHIPTIKHRKHHKKNKKSKRDAYGYNSYKHTKWASKSSNFGYGDYSSNLPLYLVYNKKVGAYYPFYKYPRDNSVRRHGNLRKVSRN